MLKSPGVKCQCTYGVTIPKDTYKLRGGGRGGDSTSDTTLRGAVFGRAPPHPLESLTDFAAVSPAELVAAASVSL